jgi:chemotaxis protein CheC
MLKLQQGGYAMHNPVRYTGQPVLISRTGGEYSPENTGEELLPDSLCTQENLKIWRWLVNKGITNAMTGLSQMVEQDINVTSLDLKRLPAERIVELPGNPEITVVGVYLTIEGDASGHLVLIYHPDIAFRLVDLLLGLPEGSTISMDEIGRSILGEMGNITGAFFLNALADSTSLVLMPSPPSVLTDTINHVMSIPMKMLRKTNNTTLAVKATFATNDIDLAGTFLVLPGIDLVDKILNTRTGKIIRQI